MTGISLGLAAAALGCLVMAIGVDPSAAQQDQNSQGPTQGPTLSHGRNAKVGTDGSSQTRSPQNGSPESGFDIKVQTAQVGAGTVDDVTTGSSGPKKKSSSGPTSPEASLCNSYDGAVKADCMQTVLRNGGKQPAGANANAQQPNSGAQGQAGQDQNGDSGGHSESGPSNHGG